MGVRVLYWLGGGRFLGSAPYDESEGAIRCLPGAFYDGPADGILNRNGLNELVKKIFASARVRLSVMVIDVDHFKKINDQRGHDAGIGASRAGARD